MSTVIHSHTGSLASHQGGGGSWVYQTSLYCAPPAGLHLPPGGGIASGHRTQQGYANVPDPCRGQPTQPPLSWVYQAPAKTDEHHPLSPERELNKPQHHHEPMPPPPATCTKPSEKSERHGTCINEADHHTVLFKQLAKHSAEWRNIGRGLGFIPSDLDVIQAKPLLLDSAPSSWLEAILAQWLRSGGRLETLKCALREAGLGQTANDLHI